MKKFLLFFFLTIVIVSIPVTMYLLTQEQDIRSNADEFDDLDQLAQNTNDSACQTPEGIQNVSIDYPYCQGNQCTYSQGGCSWDPVTGVSQYTVTISKVEANTVVKTESVTTTSTSFPVDSGNTYKCDVAAVNSCGTSGPIGTNQLFCELENFVDEPTPTVGPTTTQPTVAPTVPPVIVPTNPPYIPPTQAPPPTVGNTSNAIMIGLGSLAMIIIGGLLFTL
jgi:hypothetical protein